MLRFGERVKESCTNLPFFYLVNGDMTHQNTRKKGDISDITQQYIHLGNAVLRNISLF